MKKLNTSNAFAMLALGFTLVVVAAGFGTNSVSADSQLMSTPTTKATKTGSSDSGAGNGTSKSAPTTIAKTGSSDGGSGNGSSTSSSVKSAPTTIAKSAPTTIAKTGSADGGTGKSVTVSDSGFKTCDNWEKDSVCKENVASLTNSQMNALTSAQWETVDGYLQASQVASIPTKTIKNLSTTALIGLSSDGTKALTTAQLKVMSKDQLNALVSSGELTETQLVTVNKKLTQLG